MSESMLNVCVVIGILILFGLLIREWLNGIGYQFEAEELRARLAKQSVTFDRMYRERNDAQDIADHAIAVITEARMLVANQKLSDRLDFLTRSFVDRRQEAANEKALADEIDKITGGNV